MFASLRASDSVPVGRRGPQKTSEGLRGPLQASKGFKKPQRLTESRAGMGRLKKDFKEILQGLTGKTNKWADEWKSPSVLQDIAPSGLLPCTKYAPH